MVVGGTKQATHVSHKGMARWARVLLPLAGMLALLLSACGQAAPGASLAKDQRFVWPFVSSDGTNTITGEVLDPSLISSATDFTSASLIYSGLVTLNSSLHVVNDLARSIDVDPTGKKYTFHLLPNLAFSDGKPIHAQDFAYAMDRSLDPSNTAGLGITYLGHILGAGDRSAGKVPTIIAQGDNPNAGISVVDDQTLVIRLDAPIGFFLEALTYPTSYPVEKSLVDKYPGGAWVNHLDQGGCSGPFMVKSYGGGKELSYIPNPNWSKATHHNLILTEIDRPFVTSVDAEYTNYRAGQYDYTDVPDNQSSYARGQDDYREVGELAIDYFGLNFTKPPFDNLQIRQAFDLALQRQVIVDRNTQGGATPTYHIVPQGMPGYDVNLTNPAPDGTQAVTGNQDAAQKLMKQVRANCQGLTNSQGVSTDPDYCPYIMGNNPQQITFSANGSNQTRVDITRAAAAQWSFILGLNVVEQTVTFKQILNIYTMTPQADPFQAWAVGWLADYPDPQDWLTLQFASTAPYNASGVSDPALDAEMAKADVEQDPVTRAQDYNQIEQQIVAQVPWIPFMQEKAKWRLRSWVHGFTLNSLAVMPDISWPSVYVTTPTQ
jgi:peptide/nickel transport system substrate-binding protein/oligopeptide transport system substrate-binding protein